MRLIHHQGLARWVKPTTFNTHKSDLFVGLAAKGYVPGIIASAEAMDEAETALRDRLAAFDYAA